MTEETYCLLDTEGDWWVSPNGDEWMAADVLGEYDISDADYPIADVLYGNGIDPGDVIYGPRPNAVADGYSWGNDRSTIATDAHRVVYGRGDNYGHPRDNHTRIAQLWTALLSDHLQDGAYITPEDVARCMVAMKLARDVQHPKRDNRVDGIGYFIALDRMETGK